MERRSSIRRPIQLHAQLSTSGAKQWPCTIADFCAEGLYIKYANAVSRLIEQAIRVSPDLLIYISFVDDITGIEHQLSVQPVRVIDGAMGCRYASANTSAMTAMLTMCAEAAEDNVPNSPSEKNRFIIRQCSREIVSKVKPLLDHFFEHVDESLIDVAAHASSDQISTELMNAAGLIKERQKRIYELFLGYLSQPLSTAEAVISGENAAKSLSLIDKSEFEDWLMFKVMVTKAETLYRGPLLQLKMRLDHLDVISDKGYQNPLGPSLLVYAFRDSIGIVDLPHCAFRPVFRAFENTVMRNLEALFNELNNILVRQNILPDLDLSKYVSDHRTETVPDTLLKKAEGEPSAEPKSTAEPGQGANTVTEHTEKPVNTEASPRHGDVTTNLKPLSSLAAENGRSAEHHNLQELAPPFIEQRVPYGSLDAFKAHQQAAQVAYENIRELFSSLSLNKKKVENEAHKASWGDDDLWKNLEVLQRAAMQGEAVAEPLLNRAKAHLNMHDEGLRLSDTQADTFDIVDRFFISLKSSQKLTDSTKSQLKRLEVPLFKVLLKNKAFFSKVDSPVRAVINRIAQLGIKGGRPNPTIERKIDQLITRINHQFDQNPAVFDETLIELDELIARQNQIYRKNVERVTAAAEGEQKVETAKRKVAIELDKRVAGRKVPKAIISLLNGGWQDLLALTHIRQGAQSQAWQDYLGVLDSLLAYAEDPDLGLNLKEILQIIQEGLTSISSNQVPPAQIREDLKRFIVGNRSGVVEWVDVPEGGNDVNGKGAKKQTKGVQRWVHRAQKLRPGEWLRYQKSGQAVQFMRLVWIGAGYSQFVFVNHQGMKVIELSLEKLTGYLAKGLVSIEKEYETPIVDSSLDMMVKKVYDQLSFVATHDELTGCINRKEYVSSVASSLSQDVEGEHFSVVHLDLHGVRHINETSGYDAGDAAIKYVAGLLQTIAPESALKARLSGTEFGIFLRDGDAEGVAHHLLNQLQAEHFQWKARQHELQMSAGVAQARMSLNNATALLAAAEKACVEARQTGYGEVKIYQPDHAHRVTQAVLAAKVSAMNDLNKERILLRCQKIIPLQSQTRLGAQYEILLSIYDNKGNLIPANEFIRTAEHYNRMQAVDRWVVGHMLDWMDQNRSKVAAMGGVCINLSGHSLNDETLTEFIYDRLSQRDAPIEKLWFELTEAAAIANIYDVADFMNELKEIGCRFCLGNFGAGMSSYHFLKELPVDMIKIDGTFIRNLTTDESDRAMIRSMTEMVHFMGKELIASQVEDKQCLEMLTEMGVDYAQGFAIEKPRLIDSF